MSIATLILVLTLDTIYATKICIESKCEITNDQYICPNANLTFIPIAAADANLLDLSSNRISTLENHDFNDFTRLRILIMSNVSLKVIQRGTFRKLKTLEYLDLSINLLKSIHPDTFADTIIQHLNLSGNIFKRLVHYQFPTPHLRILDLSNGFLEIIPETSFSNCTSLRWLNLSSNRLKTLQIKPILVSCQRLEVLILHQNWWLCDCDFYTMSQISIVYNYSTGLRCDNEKEYRYANDTSFLRQSCEIYMKKSISGMADKTERKDVNVQDLILNVYGYMLGGVGVLIILCCCCKGQTAKTDIVAKKHHVPIIDHFPDEQIVEGKQVMVHVFDKCQVEFHQQNSNDEIETLK